MSWQIAVKHRTGYRYESPVYASYNEARMTPLSTAEQLTLDARLEVSPVARPLRYTDYWGTSVHAFDVHQSHTELLVTATSVVETARRPTLGQEAVGWETLADMAHRERFADLLTPSKYVVAEDEVNAVAAEIAATSTPEEAGMAGVGWAHESLRHTRGATTVRTTSAEARAAGAGVCQDFSHLALAVLRAMQLPARYVSGYLYSAAEPELGQTCSGESHAWVEFWAGRWVAADPSSLRPVGERHVLVAHGRDYGDVRPLSGIYSGTASQALGVTVELTRLR
jgi:transglutaminase-like putative cysteine protease